MLRAACLAFLACLLVFAPARAASKGDDLRTAAEALRMRDHVPAMGVGVIDRGRVVFLGGLGEIDGRPATADDRFRAASISKLFTAQAAMRLIEDGRLSLDDDVGRYVPAFAGRGITVRNLMTHHAGLQDRIFPLETADPARVAAYVELLARQPPGKPGAGYAYTDADFNLLGAVITAVTGEPFAGLVDRTIAAPLRLGRTSIFPAPDARAGLAAPFINKPAVRPATPRPFDIAFAPSEGLTISARDLTTWLQATLNRDRRILKRGSSFNTMVTGHEDMDRPGRYAGLGWQLRIENGHTVAEHAGGVHGYNALVVAWPDAKRGVVILTNADDAPRREIAAALAAALGPTR